MDNFGAAWGLFPLLCGSLQPNSTEIMTCPWVEDAAHQQCDLELEPRDPSPGLSIPLWLSGRLVTATLPVSPVTTVSLASVS